MSIPTLIVIGVIVFAFVITFLVEARKRPKPQPPPHDVSDKSRFEALKRDWQKKQ
jgi:hypothetical protein